MNERRDKQWLAHILDAAKEIETFVAGKTKEDLRDSRLMQRAIEKDLEIIGEAAGNLSEETRDALDSVPWKDIIGMRNILVHVYFDIDLEVIWKTVQQDIPLLISQISDELSS